MRLSDFKTYGPALPRKVEERSARWIQTVLHLSQVIALSTGPCVGAFWQALSSAVKPRPTRDKKAAALFFISKSWDEGFAIRIASERMICANGWRV